MFNRFDMSVRTESDYVMLIDTLRNMGLPVKHHYQLEKETWQSIVDSQGFNITSLGTNGIQVGPIMFVFSTGSAYYLNEDENSPIGPHATFLFAYDMSKQEVLSRRVVNFGNGQIIGNAFGPKAISGIKEYID